MRSDEYFGEQRVDEGCIPVDDAPGTINCGVGTTLMDCTRGPQITNTSLNLSDYFIWNRTMTSEVRNVSTVFRFGLPVNIGRMSMWFWNAPASLTDIPNIALYSSNDVSTTPSNPVTIDTSKSAEPIESRRYRLNVDIINGGLMIQSLKVMMSITSGGSYILLSEVLFCGKC